MVPKSLAPSTGADWPSSSISAAGSIPQATQCVNVPPGASGSSTISASELVPSGTPDQTSAGERSSASQVWRGGTPPPRSEGGAAGGKRILPALNQIGSGLSRPGAARLYVGL